MKTCKLDDCQGKHFGLGVCQKHYVRFRKYNSYEIPQRISYSVVYKSEFYIWQGMKQRCYNPNEKYYRDYGGRGIQVCDRWLNSFQNFLEDMGTRPSKSHSIDRRDNNGNYEPDNCHWATKTEQSRNTRIHRDNNTGVRGVRHSPTVGRYTASISNNNKVIHLGTFKTLKEATMARQAAENKYWSISPQELR